ncbi:MAG: hypothetical protein HY505_00825 [Candidatus Yanofskybacteria bacterium]|nr:hypothetical protein [Candidatus Yanofskybacteria bacterium]
MFRFVALRLWFLLFFVTATILLYRNFQSVDLPELIKLSAGADSCIVSEEAARVHNGEKGFENAWIDLVNDDSTIQVRTIDTKLSLLFRVPLDRVKCFHKNSLAPVTIAECKNNQKGECDFSLPHIVYIGTESVQILNWKYNNSAS